MTSIPVHSLARNPDPPACVESVQYQQNALADYEYGARSVGVKGDQVTYGDYLLEALIRLGYTMIDVRMEDD